MAGLAPVDGELSWAADLELCYLSGVEAIERYNARTLSPFDLVSALIERIEAVEPKVNALTYTFFDRALEQAQEAERRYTGQGRPRRLGRLADCHQRFS